MNKVLTEIVTDRSSVAEIVNVQMLLENTRRLSIRSVKEIHWDKLEHLHILSSYQSHAAMEFETIGVDQGLYIDESGRWMLAVGATFDQISFAIQSCSDRLKILDVRHTDIDQLNISHLVNLEFLNLSINEKLAQVYGMERLALLQKLNIADTDMGPELNLNPYTYLSELHMSFTRIDRVMVDHPLDKMTFFVAHDSKISDVDFLRFFPSLKFLVLSDCPVTQLPQADYFPNLNYLDVSFTKITSIPRLDAMRNLQIFECSHTLITFADDAKFPSGILILFLGELHLKKLPEGIKELKYLNCLDLHDSELDELPDWLPQLNLPIGVDTTNGIRLKNTKIKGVDMSIFAQPQEMILQWFEARKKEKDAPAGERQSPLNEIKVVFLGDGEAGKSLTVARLLNGGVFPENFDGSSTPGIAISDWTYTLDGRNIQIHFWDFGGQEILHSMHRMFLTERTMYVILLNARDDTQDDRARYWLHNVKSFANGAPVLLVLNKTDQNPHASVNESDLRALYPNLTHVVRMSALEDSTEVFNERFTDVLYEQIAAFETLESPFLESWNHLKNRLQTMPQNYIRGQDYKRISEECGVQDDEPIRKALLKWFNDLGVSFCYGGSVRLEDYVILRPDWITNAIYIILFNRQPGVTNGIISHNTIHRMLNPSLEERDSIKRVLPDVVYSTEEIEYVLNVVRKFRLSYLVKENEEFIPMLCERDSLPIANTYAEDPNTLEFRIVYDYLPNNIIHRLMVDMRLDLDQENVWLTGARFAQKGTGLSAVVKSDGNVLKIYVRNEDPRHPADIYLNIIRTVIEQINDDLGLQVAESPVQVVYKADDISEIFDYDYLVGSLKCGGTTVYSRKRKRVIDIEDILSQTDHSLVSGREKLHRAILLACQQMQNDMHYWKANENARNTFVRNILQAKGYYVSDQSLGGRSEQGKQPGELDLVIRQKADMPWTLYEALIIHGASQTDMSNWDLHLKKLLDNYNPNGLPFLFLASYLECSKDNFNRILSDYFQHMKENCPDNYTIGSISELPVIFEGYDPIHYIRTIVCKYNRGGYLTMVYHIFVRFGP